MTDFDPEPYFANPKEARRTDRFAQFALAAAAEALGQSGELQADPLRIGTWIGTGIGGLTTLEEQVLVHENKGARRVSPFMVPMLMANARLGRGLDAYGFQGPCENTVHRLRRRHPVDRQRLPAHRLRPLRRHGHRQLRGRR